MKSIIYWYNLPYQIGNRKWLKQAIRDKVEDLYLWLVPHGQTDSQTVLIIPSQQIWETNQRYV